MRRLGILTTSFVIGLAGLVGAMLAVDHGDALRAGESIYRHRPFLQRLLGAGVLRRPLVVWIGDSTIAGLSTTYPRLVGRSLAARGHPVETRVIADPGLEPFDYYFLTGPALDLGPQALVLVAHLRTFGVEGGGRTFGDLASMVPSSELLRTMALPLHERGITIPRLLMARLLRVEAGEHVLYVAEGLRWRFRNAALWEHLGPRVARMDEAATAAWMAGLRETLDRRYDVPIGPGVPAVRMLRAAVALGTRRGVPTLVVGNPLPRDQLRARGAWDDQRFAARFAVLREVTEAAGGTFLDLHAALGHREFRDAGGHYNRRGTARMAELVEPALRAALRLDPPDG